MMITKNYLILNYPKDLCLHAHLIHCEDYLKKVLKLPNQSKIDWCLLASIITRTPKFLHLYLRKSLLNFVGAAHQLHRQKVYSSPICRCCLLEP